MKASAILLVLSLASFLPSARGADGQLDPFAAGSGTEIEDPFAQRSDAQLVNERNAAQKALKEAEATIDALRVQVEALGLQLAGSVKPEDPMRERTLAITVEIMYDENASLRAATKRQAAELETLRGRVFDYMLREEERSQNAVVSVAPQNRNPPPSAWVPVLDFSGTGDKTSSRFTVGLDWRVRWTCESVRRDGGGIFYVNATGTNYQSMAGIDGSGSDVSYGEKAGTYQLSVSASGDMKWRIVVEVQR